MMHWASKIVTIFTNGQTWANIFPHIPYSYVLEGVLWGLFGSCISLRISNTGCPSWRYDPILLMA